MDFLLYYKYAWQQGYINIWYFYYTLNWLGSKCINTLLLFLPYSDILKLNYFIK